MVDGLYGVGGVARQVLKEAVSQHTEADGHCVVGLVIEEGRGPGGGIGHVFNPLLGAKAGGHHEVPVVLLHAALPNSQHLVPHVGHFQDLEKHLLMNQGQIKGGEMGGGGVLTHFYSPRPLKSIGRHGATWGLLGPSDMRHDI